MAMGRPCADAKVFSQLSPQVWVTALFHEACGVKELPQYSS